jgi:CTP:molybdopterin cytidylyltransferase MocA
VTPAGVVLAAGAGRRLGRPKALVELGGELLVERAVRVLRAADVDPVVVVLGAAAAEVTMRARLDAVVVVNDAWETGMASSFIAGLRAADDADARAAVVVLVDQPYVGADVVRRLVDSWRSGATAVVASYGGQPRNPVLLDRTVWADAIAAAHDDVGARGWLRASRSAVTVVACDDLGSDTDIDTPADLARLTEDV